MSQQSFGTCSRNTYIDTQNQQADILYLRRLSSHNSVHKSSQLLPHQTKMPPGKPKKVIILAALATIFSLLCYDVQVTGGLFKALNSRALSLYHGNGMCEYVPAIQWTDYGFPSSTTFTKTIIAGYPSGDKRMFYLQLEGLSGLSARDEWEFMFLAHTNQPFIKANYPHHEGIWGWGDVADQVVLVVSDLKRVMIEYHDILWDIGYAQTFEEAYERMENLYKDKEEGGTGNEDAPVEDFLVWRDLRLFDEVHWYSWFMDFYMEAGLMRDIFSHKKTVPAQWHMSILPNFFTKFEVRHGRFVNESEPIEDSYDPMCSTLSKGCYPVMVVDPSKLVDPVLGPAESRKIGQVINGTEGFDGWTIDGDAWECIWNELIINKKGIATFMDKSIDYESYSYSFEIKNEMWHELTRLIEKYEVKNDQVAIDLVEILRGHREELGVTEPADPLTYEELMSYHLAFPPFFPHQKMFKSDDDFYVNVHEEYGNYDTSYETIIDRRRKFFELEMDKKRERKVTVNYYDANGWRSLPEAGLASLTPYETATTYKINYPPTEGEFAGSGRSNDVAALFQGYLYFDPTIKTICVTSDDGSKLYLENVLVIDNDGLHSPTRKCTAVTEGIFKLDLEYFEREGGSTLILEFGPSVNQLRVVPPRSWASNDSQRRYRELMRLNELILKDVETLKETDFMGPATRAAFNMKKKAEGKAKPPTVSSEDRRLMKEALHNFYDFEEIQKLPKKEQLKVMRSMFGG